MTTLELPTILIVITKGDIGGAQIHCLDIMRRLKNQYRFVLVCGEEEFLTKKATALGVQVRVLKELVRPVSLKLDRLAYIELKKIIRELRPSLIHSHSSKAGVIARIAAFNSGVPSLFTAHGWAFTKGVSRKRWLLGLLSELFMRRYGATVLAVSEYDYKLARRYLVSSNKKLHLVQNGVEASNFSVRIESKIPQIINIGRLGSQKNQRFLVECLSQLGHQNFTAKIIGSGDQYTQLQSQIKTLGLEGKVQLVSNVESVAQHLAESEIFVLSSNYEGLPLSILEAMSTKLPVISTEVGGVGEAVIDGKTGYLVGRNDHQAMIEKINLLLRDKNQRIAMGEAGYKRYQTHFTAERMVNDINKVYQQELQTK